MKEKLPIPENQTNIERVAAGVLDVAVIQAELDEPTGGEGGLPLPDLDETIEELDTLDYGEKEDTGGADDLRLYLNTIGRTRLLTAEQEVELAKKIEAGLYAEEKLRMYKEGELVLSGAETYEFQTIIHEGERAKNHMLEVNLRLVVSIAKRYQGRGTDFLDLIQYGNLGLIRAVEKFDYVKGFKFSTYATWWIRQAITRSVAEYERTIRIPVHMVETINRMRGVTRHYLKAHGEEPDNVYLASQLGLTPEKVAQIKRIDQELDSLDRFVSDDGSSSLSDLVADPTDTTVEEAYEAQFRTERIGEVLGTLTAREAKILILRYGIGDGRPRTLEEIAKEMGLSRQRINQIENVAIGKLRHSDRARLLYDL